MFAEAARVCGVGGRRRYSGGETIGSSDIAPDFIPPPPGFPPFSWPVIIGNVNIEQSCFPFGDERSPDVRHSQPDVEPPFSPMTPAHEVASDSVGSPEVGLLVDIGTDTAVDVRQPVSPLPSIENLFLQDILWAREFPAEEVAAGALGPRVRRASVQMEAMGLWRPSLDPLRLHW